MSDKLKEKEIMIYLWLLRHMREEADKNTIMQEWSLES